MDAETAGHDMEDVQPFGKLHEKIDEHPALRKVVSDAAETTLLKRRPFVAPTMACEKIVASRRDREEHMKVMAKPAMTLRSCSLPFLAMICSIKHPYLKVNDIQARKEWAHPFLVRY
jgi:hypothetical protein